MGNEEARSNEPNIGALLSVLLAGLLALIGCLASLLGLLLQADLLFQSLSLAVELGDVGDRMRNHTAAAAFVLLLVALLGLHNILICLKWRAFLAGRWRRYLINSAAGLVLFGVLQYLRYVV